MQGKRFNFKVLGKIVIFLNFFKIGQFFERTNHKTSLQSTGMGKGNAFAFVVPGSHKYEVNIDSSGASGYFASSTESKFDVCRYIKNFFRFKIGEGELENLIIKIRLSVIVNGF